MREIDVQLFRWINQWPDGLAPFFRFWSLGLDYAWVKYGLILMVVGMLIRGPKTRRAAISVLLAVGLANELTDILKETFKGMRPVNELADVIARVGYTDSFGTASAHSANMAAIAFCMAYWLRGWGAPWVAIAFFVGLSRIYVGVHYPYQVLLGWACGILMGLVVVKGIEAFDRWRRRNDEPEDEQPELA